MKDFRKKNIVVFILINVLAAAVLFALIVWITLKAIDRYTEHGVVETVPDLRGAYMEEAEVLLAAQGLYPQVVDSVYMYDKKLGTIVEQTPSPGSTVKRNRPVYLVVNSRQIRKMALPAVNDFSLRQASSMIRAGGLEVADIEYVPSEYRDLVIDVLYKGESIPPGTMIPEGDSVVLVVGWDTGTETVVVPKLIGLGQREARVEIIAALLTPGAVNYDVDTKSDDNTPALVYRQEPIDGSIVPGGTKVDLWLTTDPQMLQQSKQQGTYTNSQEEEFF